MSYTPSIATDMASTFERLSLWEQRAVMKKLRPIYKQALDEEKRRKKEAKGRKRTEGSVYLLRLTSHMSNEFRSSQVASAMGGINISYGEVGFYVNCSEVSISVRYRGVSKRIKRTKDDWSVASRIENVIKLFLAQEVVEA